MALREYFQPEGQRRALEAYAKFADDKQGWPVSEKMRLYEKSFVAFSPTTPDDVAFKAFTGIYENLRRIWQAFRTRVRGGRRWSAQEVFDAIRREFPAFGWTGEVTLISLHQTGQSPNLLRSLAAMRDIKANSDYPTMTVSKFLHFYNPALFPIYDRAVVKNKVGSPPKSLVNARVRACGGRKPAVAA